MTEAEWNSSTDPEPMFNYLCSLTLNKALEHKFRLFACSCVRRVWNLLVDPRARTAVEVAERYTRKQATLKELDKAYFAACDAADERGAAIDQMNSNHVTLAVLEAGSYLDAAASAAARDIRNGAIVASRIIAGTVFGKGANAHPDTQSELAIQAQLLRDIFGSWLR